MKQSRGNEPSAQPHVSRETSSASSGATVIEPLPTGAGDYLGPAADRLIRFAHLLAGPGVERGLVGPREPGRLWTRHILNSAALAPLLPEQGTVIDVGSGAGLPGVVLACLQPALGFTLLEPMARRVEWLQEVAATLDLANVTVIRDRAEASHGHLSAGTVVARAVAPLERLVRWTLPLLQPGGSLLAIKGERAAAELATAAGLIRSLGAKPELLQAGTVPGVAPTTVVRVVAPD